MNTTEHNPHMPINRNYNNHCFKPSVENNNTQYQPDNTWSFVLSFCWVAWCWICSMCVSVGSVGFVMWSHDQIVHKYMTGSAQSSVCCKSSDSVCKHECLKVDLSLVVARWLCCMRLVCASGSVGGWGWLSICSISIRFSESENCLGHSCVTQWP